MYRGRRKRIRKRDVTSVTTYIWPGDINIAKFVIADKDNTVRIIDNGAINGMSGDSLEVTVYMTLVDNGGEKVLNHHPFVLLPAGKTYYSIDEEDV